MKHQAMLLVQEHAGKVKDVEEKVAELANLIAGKQDPDWETLALSMISHL